MSLPNPCSGQELAQKITDMQKELDSFKINSEKDFEIITQNSLHIGDLLNTYRNPGDKYLLCNGATISDETTYSALIALLGGNTLPTINPAFGRTYIKAKD